MKRHHFSRHAALPAYFDDADAGSACQASRFGERGVRDARIVREKVRQRHHGSSSKLPRRDRLRWP